MEKLDKHQRKKGDKFEEHQYYITSNSPKSALAKHSLN